ncbi:MAG: hypothetical protein HQL21_09015 [Candidatus Omnitrophica bacterium]|nr:hypothetical protein [Candidatus Omnitrophota bacterium]
MAAQKTGKAISGFILCLFHALTRIKVRMAPKNGGAFSGITTISRLTKDSWEVFQKSARRPSGARDFWIPFRVAPENDKIELVAFVTPYGAEPARHHHLFP